MTNRPNAYEATMQRTLDDNAARAKKLRAKARRLEAQGKLEEAGRLREEIDGLRWENVSIRGW